MSRGSTRSLVSKLTSIESCGLIDEILVNAADNFQRDKSTTTIRVTIDQKAGKITVENNGKGIPI
jgi:DNA gyrase/topoisomerase IV subunit B